MIHRVDIGRICSGCVVLTVYTDCPVHVDSQDSASLADASTVNPVNYDQHAITHY